MIVWVTFYIWQWEIEKNMHEEYRTLETRYGADTLYDNWPESLT